MGDKKESNEAQAKQEKVDDELSELLDSALEDFGKEPKTTTEEKKDEKKDVATGGTENASEDLLDMEKLMQDFENNFAPMLGLSSAEEETFKKMTDAAREMLMNVDQVPEDSAAFATFIAEGLQQAGARDGSVPDFRLPEGMLEAMTDPNSAGMFGRFIEDMMQTVLRKDAIYPALKNVADLYPGWLEENKDKISQEDAQRYRKQLELMQEVCAVLETEKEDDVAEVRVQRMDKVVSLMQKMQDYGDIPPDLLKEGAPQDVPPLPNMENLRLGEEQCSIM